MRKLYVLYDDSYYVSRHWQIWMQEQVGILEFEMIPMRSPEAARRFPGIGRTKEQEKTGEGSAGPKHEELVVVSDEGAVYRGPSAWIMCLYALENYREWSIRLAHPLLLPLVRQAASMLPKNRQQFAEWYWWGGEEYLAQKLTDNRFWLDSINLPKFTRTCG